MAGEPVDAAAEGRTVEVVAEAGAQPVEPSAPVEPTLGMQSPGRMMAEAVALPGPVDAAAEAGTRPSPERPAPVKPTPSVPSPGRMIVWGPSGTPNPPEVDRGETSAPPVPGRPANPFLAAIEGVQVAVERLGAAVEAKEG
jgi:hypothetical protein